jgi:signal transduction histidine kinase/ligand-binding sensor domain-containing protein
MQRIRILTFLLLTCSLALHAQRRGYPFNHIGVDDGLGLASNRVYSLLQDEKGFIWLGTANGLQRFDGGKFVRFDPRGTKGNPLPTVAVEQLLPAGRGRIWIAAPSIREFGIFDFSTFSYTVVPLKTNKALPARSEFKLWQDSLGHTFINVFRYGKVLVYDSLQNAFTENTPLNNLPKGWNLRRNAYYDHAKRQYWLVCDSGFAVYDARSGEMWTNRHNPKKIPLLDNPQYRTTLSEIYIDRQRRHWVFYWTGSQVFSCFDSSYRPLPADTAGLNNTNTSYAELSQFRETSNGTLWIYGLANLYSRDSGSARFALNRGQYIDNFGIRYEYVYDVMEDRDGLVWIATDQGLYYTATSSYRVANFFLSEIPGYYEITDLVELRNGDYWISTWGRGVITMDAGFRAYPSPLYRNVPKMDPVSRVAYNQVWALCEDPGTGKVYLGCQRGQIIVFDPKTQQSEFLHPRAFNNRTIRYIAPDKKGRLWFGTQGGQLIRYDGTEFKSMADFGDGAIVFKVFVDRDGWIWAATQDMGIYALDPETGSILRHYVTGNTDSSLFGQTCNDIEQLNDSLFYLADAALSILNKRTGKIRNLTSFDGLPSNSVKKIRLDRKGFLWIITDNGLCRYDHQRKLFTTYGKKDGILLAHLTDKADFLCSEDYVMFTGTNSLMFFHPDAFRYTKPPPDVTITDFLLGDSYIPVDSLQRLPDIRLKPDQNFFVVSFASIDFRNRDKFIYHYRVEGLHDDWIKAESMDIVFTGLAPGRYTLRIKAENLEGQASAHETVLRFRVSPPFWRAPWFLLLLAAALAALARYIYLLRVRRRKERALIRNRIARDLHDDMGSTLSTINILSSMAKSRLHQDPEKTGEYIGKISDNSQRMMEAMDDIVWAIKPDNDSMQKIVARMREFSTSVLEAKEIDLQFHSAEDVNQLKLDMEQRRDLFLFFKEAVNNVAKYSRAAQATIRLAVHQGRLLLIVEDNGTGFEVDKADGGNGLGNMRKRADAMRGRFQVQSSPGTGTKVTLNIPVS